MEYDVKRYFIFDCKFLIWTVITNVNINHLFPNDLNDLTCYYINVINPGSNVFLSYYRSCLRKNLNQLQMKWH